jgi:putative sigma-54 modulation protein
MNTNIAITFRQMEATEAMKGYATEKVAKLQKFLRKPMKGKITLSCTQHRLHSAEIDLHAGAEHFHAHETSEDMYASIDKVVDKLEAQIREVKGAISSRRKGAERASQRLLSGEEPGEE